MTTIPDLARGNFNGDVTNTILGGSAGDLILTDANGDKAIWLENGAGGRLASAPSGFELPFTGPTWHIVAAADFDTSTKLPKFVGGTNPSYASDLLFQNDNGLIAIWQSTGDNGIAGGPFSANFNQATVGNPGAGWHVVGADDINGDGSADILFQHTSGLLAIWEMQSTNAGNVLQGPPVSPLNARFNVDQNPGATWHVVGTGDITGNAVTGFGIVFQNDNGAIAAWENPTLLGQQFHFFIQSNLPNPGAGWHVMGMGNITEQGLNTPGQDIVLQNDNGDIAIWQLQVMGNQVVRQGAGFDLGNPGPGWHVVGVRDMNVDGRADLLLQNDNGAAAVWTNIQANGTHDGFNFNPQPNSGHLDWHVV
jgi:hypothetical protein